MLPMTKIRGVPDRANLKPGMAHYDGSGPPGKTCGDCQHRGYMTEAGRRYGCAVFYKLTGKSGPAVGRYWRACKYFLEIEHAETDAKRD